MSAPRMPPRFTEEEDCTLLAEVSGRPVLFDWRLRDYRNAKVKADVWDTVALSVGRDVETCKRRWKDIKDNYYKIRRQGKLEKCKWLLVPKLAFLDNVEPERRMVMSYECEEAGVSRDNRYDKDRFMLPPPEIVMTDQEYLDDQNTQETMDGLPEDATPRKRKFEDVSTDDGVSSKEAEDNSGQGSSWAQEDDVDLFMRSIALQVKKLPPRLIAQAKVRILTAVNEIQFGQIFLGVKKEPQNDGY